MNTTQNIADETSSLYEQLVDDISSGSLSSGERLKVAELARRYGVSTSPVREVLRQLQGEGLVEISHNRGAAVKAADADTIRNIFEILQLLEPYFVAWFAKFAQPEMVDEMQAIQDQMAALPRSDRAAFRKLDTDFHWIICKRHYNQQAVQIWRVQRRALGAYCAKLPTSPIRYQDIMEEHNELIDAFRRSDVGDATATICKHVDGAGEQMSQQIQILGKEGVKRLI